MSGTVSIPAHLVRAWWRQTRRLPTPLSVSLAPYIREADRAVGPSPEVSTRPHPRCGRCKGAGALGGWQGRCPQCGGAS